MTKTVVIHQPDYLSYIGFYHRLIHADLFVVLDNACFSKGGWTNRDKIKTKFGIKWLSLSIEKISLNTPINQIYLSKNSYWRVNNLNLIQDAYRDAKYFDEIFIYIEDLYSAKEEKLIDFNMKSIYLIMKLLDMQVPIQYASSFACEGTKNHLLVNILQMVGATHYLSGNGARSYFRQEPFDKADIKVIWQKFEQPVTEQLYGSFIPNLSTIDVLFNCGIENSRKIIRRI
ncbi:MAG: WbqC family protein [Gammaproteobacteria bacterium]|jgi:hypothetical protein